MRGQMGLPEDEQKRSQELRLQLNGKTNMEKIAVELTQTKINGVKTVVNGSQVEVIGCCQNPALLKGIDALEDNERMVKTTEKKKKSSKKLMSQINIGKGTSTHKVCAMPTWLKRWERQDTYAALAVVCAAASVVFAYSCYKQLR